MGRRRYHALGASSFDLLVRVFMAWHRIRPQALFRDVKSSHPSGRGSKFTSGGADVSDGKTYTATVGTLEERYLSAPRCNGQTALVTEPSDGKAQPRGPTPTASHRTASSVLEKSSERAAAPASAWAT